MSQLSERIGKLSPEKRALLLQQLSKAAAPTPSIGPREQPAEYPLSFAQQRLWFLDQLHPGTCLYNIPAALRLSGRLDSRALEQSLNEILRRHEALRATFVAVGGQPVQVIAPTLSVDLPIEDLRGLSEGDREIQVIQLATAEAKLAFDLAQGPLLRARLLRLGQDEHVFLLTLHHIVSDGWSSEVLMREMAALYEANSKGKPSPLPELPIQYADFAFWQRNWLQGQALADQLGYWTQRLAGELPGLELQGQRRHGAQANQGAHFTFALPASLGAGLRSLAGAENVTLFMVLLAAFTTLLHRYARQDDICVGTPIANRNHTEIEGLIGFFVNTLVMRIDCTGEPSFRSLLRRVRQVALEAFAHPDLPFERLVEALRPERDLDRNPLFQVMFELEQDPARLIQFGGLTAELMRPETGTAKFDLTLTMIEAGDGLRGILEYSDDVFDAASIARLAEHFETLLQGIAANPDQAISQLPLLTAAERWQVLKEWNQTAAAHPGDRCIQHLFEAQVERTPMAAALVFENERWTYRELNRRANQLAHYLQALGVGPETVVAICADRSPQMVIGLLAVLKAGGAYVPLDPNYPPARLAFMLEDTQAPVLLSQARLLEHLPSHHAQTICLDADWEGISQESTANPAATTGPDNLAYVIYTSGSTGKPKGVAITHRSAVAFLAWTREIFTPQDLAGVLASTSICFDLSVFEIFAPLSWGGTIILAEDALQLPGLPATAQVTLVNTVPSAMTELVLMAGIPGSVRTVNLAGEALHNTLVQRIYAQNGIERVYNLYGPTEDTTYSTFALIARGATAVPIGRPIANSQVYVLDRYLQPMPVGVPGELYIGGAGLARGYLNRPELTAQRFIANPFDREHGRLYKTGDLVCYRPDGSLDYLGRIDQQVKMRGFRIELGEVEAALLRHPDVRAAVVTAREDTRGDKLLVAYLVAHGAALRLAELRAFLQTTLPDYMIPSAFVVLDALPLTPNGKVDRRALPAPEGRLGTAHEYVAPRDPVEEVLAAVFAQVLAVARVGVNDNFFELGGHSLLATQVISRVRSTFRLELPLRNLFEAPSVATLAAKVTAAQQSVAGSAAPPMQRVSRDRVLPLSFAQQRLWFLNQLEPDNPSYNLAGAVRLAGNLDAPALEQSLNEIVRRHEALRTTFAMVDGRPAQIIAGGMSIALPILDLAYLPERERAVAELQEARGEAQQRFDLTQGPLMRCRLVRLGIDQHLLLLTMHHIVADGWSTGVLMRELATLYEAFSTGGVIELPELELQYADFACWQRQWMQGEALESQLAYWKQQLASVPALLDLPTDRPRATTPTYAGSYETIRLDPTLTQSIRDLSRQEGATLFMTLLTAFETLLHRYCGQERIGVGTPIANRNRQEIEGLIGFFVNTLVLPANFSGDPSFRVLLRQVRETALGAYAHQDLPFELLVDALQPERDLSYAPLFQVMFVLQNAPPAALALPGLTLSRIETHSGTAKFDLMLVVSEESDTLTAILEYRTDLFDPATISRMLGHWQTLLAAIVLDPDQPISLLPLLTDAERRQLLVDWNNTDADFPREACLQHLFEAQVCRTPEANAVFFEGDVLTFTQLNRQANQLAHYLRTLGVGPDVLVGLCMQRSPELIIGLLAILKAGGAYLPLDPAYPAERLAFMLADTQVAVLVSHRNLLARLPAGAAQVVYLDAPDQCARLAQAPITNPTGATSAANLAYVIYTSGSTGKPKGVMIPHRAALNLWTGLQMVVYATQPAAPRRVSLNAPLAFDASVQEWVTLLGGHCLYIIPEDTRLDGRALLAYLRTNRLDVFDCVPSQLKLLLQEGLLDGSGWIPPVILPGGEAIDETTWQRLRAAPGVACYNMYGPTECAVDSTICPVSAAPLPSIGRPICNTQHYILDAHLQPVPVGVPGELYIGGDGVGRGYLNRPELAAERFIPHPFGPTAGRLYKTGDLVRYRADGYIEYLGRLDHQVKVRGFRIELGEIEAAMTQHPSIDTAVVIAHSDAAGNKRLVAYVVPREDVAPSAGEWRSFLQRRLPDYMVPSVFMKLDAIPLTPNGKVDRRALPAPDQIRRELNKAFTAPATPVERLLANIWVEVLGVKQVGIDDSFFELGGDSILSIQAISRANAAGLRLTPKQLFEHPTIAGLAAVADKGPATLTKCDQGIVEGPVSLTPIEHWFLEQDLPEFQHWNQGLLLTVQPTPDQNTLAKTLEHLIAHHDALRLRLEEAPSGWHQRNAGLDGDVPLTWVDLSVLSPDDQLAAIEARATELQSSLDLAKGPLMRLAYFDLVPQQPGRLLIIIHHLAVDSVSWRILIEDLQTAYQQLSRGEPLHLPLKTTSFQHWAKRLTDYADTKALAEELPYWCDVPRHQVARLPVDDCAGENTEASAETTTVTLEADDTAALLRDVPAAYGTEINDSLLTALAQTMSRWTGRRWLLITLEGHGREDLFEDVDLARTTGWFTTVYPVELDLSSADGPGEALKAVKEQLRRIPQHGIGYGLLRYLSVDNQIRELLAAQPLPEISFNYLGQFDQVLAGGSLFAEAHESSGPVHSLRGKRCHLLEISGGIIDGCLRMQWTYSRNLHRPDTIARLAQDFMRNLKELIAHCQSPEAGGYTPSDFKDVSLSDRDIQALIAEIGPDTGGEQ